MRRGPGALAGLVGIWAAALGVTSAGAQTEAESGLMTLGGFVVLFAAEGPLSYATATPRDVPADAVRVGTVRGRSCQYGLSVPVAGGISGTRLSGAVGDGGYEAALRDLQARQPALRGIYDVKVDEHSRSVLTVYRQLCVEVTAEGFR